MGFKTAKSFRRQECSVTILLCAYGKIAFVNKNPRVAKQLSFKGIPSKCLDANFKFFWNKNPQVVRQVQFYRNPPN